MIPDYTININEKVMNTFFAEEKNATNIVIGQVLEKIVKNGWEVKTEKVSEGTRYKLVMQDAFIKSLADTTINKNNNSIKNSLFNNVNNFFNKESEEKFSQDVKQKFEKIHTEVIETLLSTLTDITGITIMKGNNAIEPVEKNTVKHKI